VINRAGEIAAFYRGSHASLPARRLAATAIDICIPFLLPVQFPTLENPAASAAPPSGPSWLPRVTPRDPRTLLQPRAGSRFDLESANGRTMESAGGR
jgi:hypothetical protein